MKLAISNLCWSANNDDIMYKYLKKSKIALEVSPARILKWEENKIKGRMISPYERINEAEYWFHIVNKYYDIEVVSMEDLLLNIDNNLFANTVYRRYLLEYIKEAVRFAVMLRCPNIVFNGAANRNIPEKMSSAEAKSIAKDFFTELAEYALKSGVCISIEPVPASEATNFLNRTEEVFEFVSGINKPDIKATVDLGTIIANDENISEIITLKNKPFISHIHISEPALMPLQKRELHRETAELIKKIGYDKYVSLEMRSYPDVRLIQGVINYLRMVFKD